MRKGRHRRHREARELKQHSAAFPMTTGELDDDTEDELCEECQRRPHAAWCMAERLS